MYLTEFVETAKILVQNGRLLDSARIHVGGKEIVGISCDGFDLNLELEGAETDGFRSFTKSADSHKRQMALIRGDHQKRTDLGGQNWVENDDYPQSFH